MPTGLIGAAAKVSGPDLWAATVTAKAQIAASGGTATQPTQTQPGRHTGPAHHGPFGHAASCDGIRVTNDGIRVAGMVGEPAGETQPTSTNWSGGLAHAGLPLPQRRLRRRQVRILGGSQVCILAPAVLRYAS